jgi:hypothetical protein
MTELEETISLPKFDLRFREVKPKKSTKKEDITKSNKLSGFSEAFLQKSSESNLYLYDFLDIFFQLPDFFNNL